MTRDPDCDLCLERDARDALAERVEALTAERDALQAELAAGCGVEPVAAVTGDEAVTGGDARPTTSAPTARLILHPEWPPPTIRDWVQGGGVNTAALVSEMETWLAYWSPGTKR